VNPEQAKYQRLWGEFDGYRKVAPGEMFAEHFLSLAKPTPDQVVYDFGCGTGRGAAKIAEHCRVVGLDFAENCRDAKVEGKFEFRQHDLTRPIDLPRANFGFCTDVMEHIAPEDVPLVLRNIVEAAKRVYFNISTVEDHFGAAIGEPLHLTVQPHAWWREQLEAVGFQIAGSAEMDTCCVFYGHT